MQDEVMGVAQNRRNLGEEIEELTQLINKTKELVFGVQPEKELSEAKLPSVSKLDMLMARIVELKKKIGRINEQLELV